MSSSILYCSMLRPKLLDVGSCKFAHFLVRRLSIPNDHTRYFISNRRFNHSTANFPLAENSPAPRILNRHFYYPWTRGWRPFISAPRRRLDQESLLRVVSWNLDSKTVGRAARAPSAMGHLEEVFGDPSSPLVVMLQEVHHESLSAILEHSWIRKNFTLSNTHAPRREFTLMMVSQHVQTDRWFHIPFQSRPNGGALVVDIPISSPDGESEHPKRILRLCTTHLDPLREAEGEEPGPRQLPQVSALLKAPPTPCSKITAGLVGVAINLDTASHKAADVDLCDVWEDTGDPSTPTFERLERLERSTLGYQLPNGYSGRRLDKFFCTGMADTVPLSEVRDLTGKIGRLGGGLKTKVKTWEYNIKPLHILSFGKSHSNIWREGGVRKELDVWVSGHFAIAVGIRVRQDSL